MNPFDTDKGRAALEKVGFAARMKRRRRDNSEPSADGIVAMIDWLDAKWERLAIRHHGRGWSIGTGLSEYELSVPMATAPTREEALIDAVLATPAPEVDREGE